MRMIVATERALLERLAGALGQAERKVLLRQIGSASISGEDPGHLSFSVQGDADALLLGKLDVIETSYLDDDGGLVEVLLHFEQPRAVISWLEWFRYDGAAAPIRFPPPADALTAPIVQRMPQ